MENYINEKAVLIPFIANHRITKSGKIYFVDKETNEATEIKPFFKKFLKVIINGEAYRVDELILRTFIGMIDLPIRYKDNDRHNCEFDNLKYEIDIVEYSDDMLYINNTANMFKRIENSIYFISKNGIIYSEYTRYFVTIEHMSNDYCRSKTSAGLSDSFIHRLVYIAWVGPIEESYVIDHVDGNKWHNELSNLEMVTYSENNARAYMQNLKTCRWSQEDIHLICRMMEHNYTKEDICQMFDIPVTDSRERHNMSVLICRLKNGLWPLITSQYDLTKFKNENYRYSVLTDRDKLSIENLANRGYGSTEISRILDLNRSTVLGYLRSVGLVKSRTTNAA